MLYARTTGRTDHDERGPLLHAAGTYPPAASRTGRNVTAICGASVRPEILHEFDHADERACPACVRTVIRRKLVR
jgi:hypothetical protein